MTNDELSSKIGEHTAKIGSLLAKQLERSIARNSRLVEALKPFADYVEGADFMPDNFVITLGSPFARKQLTIGDCRKAAAVIRGTDERNPQT